MTLSNSKINYLILLFFLCFSFANSQIKVFETFDDFQSDNYTEYEQFRGFMHTMGNFKLLLRKDGKKKSVRLKKIWGYSVNDDLFRVGTKHDFTFRVIEVGSFVYYENGFPHTWMSYRNSESASSQYGVSGIFISKSLDSEIVILKSKKKVEKYIKQYPDFNAFGNCILKKESFGYSAARECLSHISI